MKIIYSYVVPEEEMTLEEFADKHNLTMYVYERKNKNLPRFYARFDAEVSEGRFLKSVFGEGDTPEEAIVDYIPQISQKLLVLNAYSRSRKEIKVPKLKV